MKILFIYPSLDQSYPLQLGALSAFIKSKGHQSQLLNLILPNGLTNSHLRQVENSIRKFKPQFVGFSGYEMAFTWIEKISSHIKKKHPHIKIIVGGYYPTLAPLDAISSPSIDIICRSEGEQPLLELLQNPRRTDIQNLWFKKNKKIIKNTIRPLMENLDLLPFPDRDMLNYQSQLNYDQKGDRTIKVMASRGCPYNCTYCSNKYLRSVVPNQSKYLRLRTPQNVIDEIKLLQSKYMFEKVGFHDDNLTLNEKWLEEFIKLYRQHVKLPFYCATRVERCNLKMLKLLKRGGCELLLLGIESGNEQYRTKIMNRYMSNAQTVTAFQNARKIGLKTWSFTMVGLPNETISNLFDTVKLNWQCKPDFVMASIFYPLKGTEMGDYCYQNGWVNYRKKEKISTYAWDTILNHPNLSPNLIKFAKWINISTSIRSPLFWKLFFQRFRDLVHS